MFVCLFWLVGVEGKGEQENVVIIMFVMGECYWCLQVDMCSGGLGVGVLQLVIGWCLVMVMYVVCGNVLFMFVVVEVVCGNLVVCVDLFVGVLFVIVQV